MHRVHYRTSIQLYYSSARIWILQRRGSPTDIDVAHKFKPDNWERLVSADRRALIDPDRFVEHLGITPGAAVADVGAGPGFFTVPLAEQVGASGTVYALDVAPRMIDVLGTRRLPPQVQVRLSGERSLPIPDASVDLAFMAFVLHELEDPHALLADVKRALRHGGRLVVVEWVRRAEEMGPPVHERLAPSATERMLRDAGFTVARDGLDDVLSASHYARIATPG